MIEEIKHQWSLDFPNPKEVISNFTNLPQITLQFENCYNKYHEYYYKASAERMKLVKQKEKIEGVLRRYYSKRYIDEDTLSLYNLSPLQENYTKAEIDSLVSTHDMIMELDYRIHELEEVKSLTTDYLSFIKKWGYNLKNFIEIQKFKTGMI